MTGLGFFIGGLWRPEQHFNGTVAQLLGSLLLLAATSLMVPTVSRLFFNTPPQGILHQSHGTAVMLLLSYGFWLYFHLRTHAQLFHEPSKHAPPLIAKRGDALRRIGEIGVKAAGTTGGAVIENQMVDDRLKPQLSVWTAVGTITISTVLIAFNTQFATESINGLLNQAGLTPTFVGLIILPLLSNDPTTLIVAYKDEMDLSLALTIEKCVQIALMVIPSVVVIGWGMGVETMTLQFNGFEVASLFASILIVNYIVQEGRCMWQVTLFNDCSDVFADKLCAGFKVHYLWKRTSLLLSQLILYNDPSIRHSICTYISRSQASTTQSSLTCNIFRAKTTGNSDPMNSC